MSTRDKVTQALAVLEQATSFTSKKARDNHASAVAGLRSALANHEVPVGLTDERAAFEAWAPTVHMRIDRWEVNPDLYDDEDAISAWLGWQARATLGAAAKPVAAEIAGLESAAGHLSALVDEAHAIMSELYKYACDLEEDQLGGRSERGEVGIMDRAEDWLAARPAIASAPKQAEKATS